ncbi:hypothetical protein MCP_0367 [Methanocella paludicola SANAE]|uniref:Uncharacterized protein n=2 Tax=Methanocella TaxID=570266 RepID=D1YVG7_METPS|nr:hypothetical protein MCP_0367 [Methanocella paludicola SANAE]
MIPMDFEKYIGKEKPLLSRLDRDRASLNAYERRGNAGTLDIAEDELKLLDTLKQVKEHIAAAEAASKALDERAQRLKELEESVNRKGAQTQKRIEEWESSFDDKYNVLLKRVEDEVGALELRNKELVAFMKAQEDIFNARSAELSSRADASEAGIKQASDNAYQEMSDILVSMKKAQKEFETSISGKLDEDKQTIDRIKYMLSTMSDIIKS